MDAGETGSNANVWKAIHQKFIDNDSPIADFFVADDLYRDANGNLPDIKTCKSPWASPTDLYKWYKQVHADMVKIVDNCDRSGKHGFSLNGAFDVDDEQYQDFVQNFARGQKAICYLGALAKYRGTSCFDWFTKTMPNNVPVVDGMEAHTNDEEQEEAGGHASSGKKSRADSASKGPPHTIDLNGHGDDGFGEQTTLDRIVAAVQGKLDSPQRSRYYDARAKQIEIKNSEEEEMKDLRILGSQAEESRKAVVGIVAGLKDISAARELSNLTPEVKRHLTFVESEFHNLLASLHESMSHASSSRKRSRVESNGDGSSDGKDVPSDTHSHANSSRKESQEESNADGSSVGKDVQSNTQCH